MPEVFELLYDTIFSTKLGWRVKENAEYTLTKLRDWRDLGSGPKIGVLSNSDDRLWGVLQDLDLAQYFDFAITSYEAKSQKPDSQLFEMAAQRAKVSTPRAAYHIGTDVDTDAAGAVSAGWTPLIFRQWFDESFPDWYAIESVEEADQGFQKRKAYMDWGRRDPARGGLEWIETWDLDDVLYLSGLPEDPEKPIHTTYLRGFLTDQKDSG